MIHISHSPKAPLRLTLCLVLFLTAPAVQAARGLVLSSFDSRSEGMAGADLASSQSTAGVNVNPAALTVVAQQGMDASLYPYLARFRHHDALDNDARLDSPAGAVAYASYARRLQALPTAVVGVGLFVQGGAGIGYRNLRTDFGNRDEVSSNFGIYKMVMGMGWSLSESLDVGASGGLCYAQARQKLFPMTSDASNPAQPFFGLRFDGGSTLAPNVQLGLQYHPRDDLNLALAYTSRTVLPFDGGTATVNFEAIGLGRVRYRQASLDGMALPQELDLGLAWRPVSRLQLSAEIDWLDYSNALRSSRLQLARPEQSLAPAQLDIRAPVRWRDQFVYALGAAWQLDARRELRMGLNVQTNPVNSATFLPTLNFMQTRQISVGYGQQISAQWSLDSSLSHQLPTHMRSENPAMPLGGSFRERYEVLTAMLTLARRW